MRKNVLSDALRPIPLVPSFITSEQIYLSLSLWFSYLILIDPPHYDVIFWFSEPGGPEDPLWPSATDSNTTFKELTCWFLRSNELSGELNLWDLNFNQNTLTALKGTDVNSVIQSLMVMEKGLTFLLRSSHIMHRLCRRDSSPRCPTPTPTPHLPYIAPLHQFPVSAAHLFFLEYFFAFSPHCHRMPVST